MTTVVVTLVGGVGGVGLVLVLAGLARRTVFGGEPSAVLSGRHVDRVVRSALAGGLAGLVVLTVTGWPVAAGAATALAIWFASTRDGSSRHRHELDLVDGIATWTEQVRDTISAANGLEHAIVATAPLAPRVLAPAVARLASRVEVQQMEIGLREFAVEVDHPMADFVVAALITTSQHQARDVAALLGHLAACARDDAAMRRRVWVGRARTRSAVRIIIGVIVVFMTALLLLDESYLAPYATATGQMVLAGVIALFGGSVVVMDRMGRIAVPDRFVSRRVEPTT